MPEYAADPDTAALIASIEQALARGEGRLIGSGYQASVHLLDSPAGRVVVKQAHRSLLGRTVGARTLRREAHVYARLRGVPGVPRSYGLVDGHLVLEHIEGPSLRERQYALENRERFFARLLETVDAMHAAGVAHGDLKRKDNVLVGGDEQPYVIDFGIAWCVSPESPRWRRAIFGAIRQMDLNAWVKLKHGRTSEEALPPSDAARWRPLWFERVARALRIPWQKVTLRRWRKRNRSR